eukprot:TRINITY_DN14186_c0_g1_i4.p2 TRINITY_DN14186_c0_g1~~TRINITY_DN14186_c0_g1_i4.p2  ORF type:complete len:100 (-),score=11.20 TRINITY_DN14186_c0_g1_i4:183-482(-)
MRARWVHRALLAKAGLVHQDVQGTKDPQAEPEALVMRALEDHRAYKGWQVPGVVKVNRVLKDAEDQKVQCLQLRSLQSDTKWITASARGFVKVWCRLST